MHNSKQELLLIFIIQSQRRNKAFVVSLLENYTAH